ncbi:MAG: STAS domain-containing protein [Lachnospiraceae bacterium]|nr:STAS domain-containing protein [Lachnospiraceae bacterium]
MTIDKERDGNQVTLQVEGKIDTLTAPQLDEVIREELDGLALLYLDLKEVDYISSAGLRVLLSTQKAMDLQGEMRIRNVNDTVLEIFDVTGFTNILNIDE